MAVDWGLEEKDWCFLMHVISGQEVWCLSTLTYCKRTKSVYESGGTWLDRLVHWTFIDYEHTQTGGFYRCEKEETARRRMSQLHVPLPVWGAWGLLPEHLLLPVNVLGWEEEWKGKENSKRKLTENRRVGKQLIWPLVNPLPPCLKAVSVALTVNPWFVG